MIFDYISLNHSFFKRMKDDYDKLLNEMKQTQEELKQSKIREVQTNKELNESKCENERVREENYKMKKKMIIFVGGFDNFCQLGQKTEKRSCVISNFLIISPPEISNFDLSSVLSFSVNCQHGVIVTNDGLLKGIGCNDSGRISNSFPNNTDQFVEFSIKDPQSRSLSPLSAACGCHCTLYLFSVINSSDKQLVFCDDSLNQGAPVFLKIEDNNPVALFSGCDNFAAIGSEGEVIFIKRESVKTSSLITAVSLPDGEKASSIACCIDSIVVLSTNGRVFSSAISKENNSLNFVCVNELNDHKFVGLSGTHNHCLVVSDNGIVFGRGSNERGKLGIGEGINESSSFVKIPSLEKYKIRAAYAGCDHSLFETQEGKILSCGCNYYGQLLLKEHSIKHVYTPTETTINFGASFCISGDFGIDFNSLKNSTFDFLLGNSSGGGQIFGTTGGVAEGSIRYIHKIITNKTIMNKIKYEELRGMKSIKN